MKSTCWNLEKYAAARDLPQIGWGLLRFVLTIIKTTNNSNSSLTILKLESYKKLLQISLTNHWIFLILLSLLMIQQYNFLNPLVVKFYTLKRKKGSRFFETNFLKRVFRNKKRAFQNGLFETKIGFLKRPFRNEKRAFRNGVFETNF